MKIDILSIGKNRDKAVQDLCDQYAKRLTQWPARVVELGGDKDWDKHIAPSAYIIALDERGKSHSSADFSAHLQEKMLHGHSHFQFLIGAADGLPQEVRGRAHELLALGKQTWPHMLVRVLILEQLYRAQQISLGHPYHRA